MFEMLFYIIILFSAIDVNHFFCDSRNYILKYGLVKKKTFINKLGFFCIAITTT